MRSTSGKTLSDRRSDRIDEAVHLIRKEKPQPPPRPPSGPATPAGIQAPGAGAPGGAICPGSGLKLDGALAAAAEAIEETVLETPAKKTLRKPGVLGGKSLHLTIVEGPDAGRSFDVTGVGTYTIGRRECDVVLNDERVSRKHASIIIVRADQYAVTDLASRNGTYVNGIRLTRRNLQHNDLVRIGNTTLRFTVFDGPVPVEK